MCLLLPSHSYRRPNNENRGIDPHFYGRGIIALTFRQVMKSDHSSKLKPKCTQECTRLDIKFQIFQGTMPRHPILGGVLPPFPRSHPSAIRRCAHSRLNHVFGSDPQVSGKKLSSTLRLSYQLTPLYPYYPITLCTIFLIMILHIVFRHVYSSQSQRQTSTIETAS